MNFGNLQSASISARRAEIAKKSPKICEINFVISFLVLPTLAILTAKKKPREQASKQ